METALILPPVARSDGARLRAAGAAIRARLERQSCICGRAFICFLFIGDRDNTAADSLVLSQTSGGKVAIRMVDDDAVRADYPAGVCWTTAAGAYPEAVSEARLMVRKVIDCRFHYRSATRRKI